MNYQSHYDALIQRAVGRRIDGPTESHHIIPRCMGGGDGKSNRVMLTPEEHYVAHQLLVRIYPEIHGLAIAAACMARDNRNGKRSNNKLYGWLRNKAALANTINQTGKPFDEDRKLKISEGLRNSAAKKEYSESRRGVKRTQEERAKISAAHKVSEPAKAARNALREAKIGVPRSEETRRKIGAHFAGKSLPDWHKQAIAESLTGKVVSPEHAENLSRALKGNKNALGAVRSPETREKMRLAALRREEARRAKAA